MSSFRLLCQSPTSQLAKVSGKNHDIYYLLYKLTMYAL